MMVIVPVLHNMNSAIVYISRTQELTVENITEIQFDIYLFTIYQSDEQHKTYALF